METESPARLRTGSQPDVMCASVLAPARLPWLLVLVIVVCLPGVSRQQLGYADLLDTKGKVILQPDRVFNITVLKAVGVFVKNVNSAYVQLWSRNSSTNFTLHWQIKITSLPIFGLNTISLDEADWVAVLPDHRLGIYNERDPGPILYSVTEYGTSVFSSSTIDPGVPPVVGEMYSFNQLKFPFAFKIMLCNMTACRQSEPTTTSTTTRAPPTTTTATNSNTTTPNTQKTTAARIPGTGNGAGGTESPLMNGTFLTVLLVWLIIITFIIITVVIVVIYLNARDSDVITKATEDKSSTADPEGDWYIVVQDTTQAQKVLTA